MVNKVIIGILVFLVILSGGLGYYAYTLNQQFNSLSEQLTAFQAEQANRIDAVSDELNTLSVETLTRVSYLGGKIDENLTQIATLKSELDGSLTKIGTLEDRLGGTLAKIDILEGEIRDIPELPQTVLDASEVYQRVSQATVRISNGDGLPNNSPR